MKRKIPSISKGFRICRDYSHPTFAAFTVFCHAVKSRCLVTELSRFAQMILAAVIFVLKVYSLQKTSPASKNEKVEIARMPPRLKHELFLYYLISIRFLIQKINYFFDEIIGTADCALLFIVISMLNHPPMN